MWREVRNWHNSGLTENKLLKRISIKEAAKKVKDGGILDDAPHCMVEVIFGAAATCAEIIKRLQQTA